MFKLSPLAVICTPPAPSGPSKETCEVVPAWIQRNDALKPSLPAATATRPLSWKWSRACSAGRVTSQDCDAVVDCCIGGAVRQPATTATATIHSSLLRIGQEPSQRCLQLLLVGLTRQRGGPHFPRLVMIPARPDRLAPVGCNLGVVTDVVSTLQRNERSFRVTLPVAHP